MVVWMFPNCKKAVLDFPVMCIIVLFGAWCSVCCSTQTHDSSCVHVYVINANPLRSSMADHLM
jgi:hypothetical protein